MEKLFIKYIILPKGIKSILFKSFVYFIPFLYSLNFHRNHWQDLLWFMFIFFLFEFIIIPTRYQLNDLTDYKSDQLRKYHWQRPINKNNKWIIFTAALTRFMLGTVIAFSLDERLGYLAILLLALQIFYDIFAKKNSPYLAILIISIAYPLRSLTVLYGLGIEFKQTVLFLLLFIFVYAMYIVFQWRRNESLFILSKKLTPKPHSGFFSSPKISTIIFIHLIALLVSFTFLLTSLAKLDNNGAGIIYIISLILVIILSLISINIFKKLISQSHNIFLAFIFFVLTFNKFFITLVISVITIFIFFWYHRIYIERFAKSYFNENHYDKA